MSELSRLLYNSSVSGNTVIERRVRELRVLLAEHGAEAELNGRCGVRFDDATPNENLCDRPKCHMGLHCTGHGLTFAHPGTRHEFYFHTRKAKQEQMEADCRAICPQCDAGESPESHRCWAHDIRGAWNSAHPEGNK